MALGVIIATSGGVPILIREIAPIFKFEQKDKELLVSSIITAMINFASEALKTDLKKITLNSFYLYIAKNDKYLVCVIDDLEDEVNFDIAKKILHLITKLDVGEDVVLTEDDEEKLWKKILEIIEVHPPSIKILHDLYKMVMGFLNEEICPKKYKITFHKKDKSYTLHNPEEIFARQKPHGTKKHFETILDDLLSFKLPKKVDMDNWTFKNVHSDLAVAAFINYQLLLREHEAFHESVSLNQLMEIARFINNRILREILVRKIGLYYEGEEYLKFAEVLAINSREILRKITKGDIEGKVWLLSVMSTHHISYENLKTILDDVKLLSKHVYYYLKYFKYYLEKIETYDTFIRELSEIRLDFKETNDPVLRLIIAKTLLALLRNLFRAFPLEIEDLETILHENLELTFNILRNIREFETSLYLKNSFVTEFADWIPFIYGCYDRDLGKRFDVKHLEELVLHYLPKTYHFYFAGRLTLLNLAASIIRYVFMFTVFMQMRNQCSLSPLENLEQFFDKRLEKIIDYSRDFYWYYYQRILYVLQYYATLIRVTSVKRTILNKITMNIDAIASRYPIDHPEKFFATLNLVLGLYLSKDPALQLLAEYRIKTLEKNFHEHAIEVLKRIKTCAMER